MYVRPGFRFRAWGVSTNCRFFLQFFGKDMSALRIGLRYERMLLLSAPLTLSALLILFIAVASDNQQERQQAKCAAEAATVLESHKAELDLAWAQRALNIKQRLSNDYNYRFAVKKAWMHGLNVGSVCYHSMDSKKDGELEQSPQDLIGSLRKTAETVAKVPLRWYGVEIPEFASLNFFGTEIKIELIRLTQALQLALAPLLLLWLGSMYGTRYRETMLVGESQKVTDIFPHLINVYAVGRIPDLRKKSWTQYCFPSLVLGLYTTIRIILVGVFIGPPLIFYLLGLYFLHVDSYSGYFVALGCLLGMFGLMNFFVELFPWHVKKIFPYKYPGLR